MRKGLSTSGLKIPTASEGRVLGDIGSIGGVEQTIGTVTRKDYRNGMRKGSTGCVKGVPQAPSETMVERCVNFDDKLPAVG